MLHQTLRALFWARKWHQFWGQKFKAAGASAQRLAPSFRWTPAAACKIAYQTNDRRKLDETPSKSKRLRLAGGGGRHRAAGSQLLSPMRCFSFYEPLQHAAPQHKHAAQPVLSRACSPSRRPSQKCTRKPRAEACMEELAPMCTSLHKKNSHSSQPI